jgi:hypothetical protein
MLKLKRPFNPNPKMPAQIVSEVFHQLAIGKAAVCQQDHRHLIGQGALGLSQHSLNRPQPDGAARLGYHLPSHGNGSAPIHYAHPHDAETVPYDGCVQAEIQPFTAPLGQGLPDQGMMSSHDINPSIQQPSAKPSLVRLSDLGTAFDIHAKPIEMHVLTLEHTDDYPTQGLEITDILPLNLTLTQIARQRIIKTGSWRH